MGRAWLGSWVYTKASIWKVKSWKKNNEEKKEKKKKEKEEGV